MTRVWFCHISPLHFVVSPDLWTDVSLAAARTGAGRVATCHGLIGYPGGVFVRRRVAPSAVVRGGVGSGNCLAIADE